MATFVMNAQYVTPFMATFVMNAQYVTPFIVHQQKVLVMRRVLQ